MKNLSNNLHFARVICCLAAHRFLFEVLRLKDPAYAKFFTFVSSQKLLNIAQIIRRLEAFSMKFKAKSTKLLHIHINGDKKAILLFPTTLPSGIWPAPYQRMFKKLVSEFCTGSPFKGLFPRAKATILIFRTKTTARMVNF